MSPFTNIPLLRSALMFPTLEADNNIILIYLCWQWLYVLNIRHDFDFKFQYGVARLSYQPKGTPENYLGLRLTRSLCCLLFVCCAIPPPPWALLLHIRYLKLHILVFLSLCLLRYKSLLGLPFPLLFVCCVINLYCIFPPLFSFVLLRYTCILGALLSSSQQVHCCISLFSLFAAQTCIPLTSSFFFTQVHYEQQRAVLYCRWRLCAWWAPHYLHLAVDYHCYTLKSSCFPFQVPQTYAIYWLHSLPSYVPFNTTLRRNSLI